MSSLLTNDGTTVDGHHGCFPLFSFVNDFVFFMGSVWQVLGCVLCIIGVLSWVVFLLRGARKVYAV